jgi:hypothetical protein
VGFFGIDVFIHAANILLLLAYSVRDILWLRLFAVGSSLVAMPYFLLQPKPLWAAFAWSVLFTGINLYQTWHLFLERRPVKLTPEEEEVRRLIFQDLPPRKFLQILGIGFWSTAERGEVLIRRGNSVDSLSLLVRGKVQITREECLLGELGPGEIVGSALLLSGAPADADALVLETVRNVRWEVSTLERYLNAHPDVREAFQRHLSRDLAGKLTRLGKEFAELPSSTAHSPSSP